MHRKNQPKKVTTRLLRDRVPGAVVCPIPSQTDAGWHIGQRVYFSLTRGEVHITPRLVRSRDGCHFSP